MEFKLFNHAAKCRCCLSSMKDPKKKQFKITQKVRQKFKDFINIELRLSEVYSRRICEACNDKLNELSEFRRTTEENQKKIYCFEEKFNPRVVLEQLKDVSLKTLEIECILKTEELFVKAEPLDGDTCFSQMCYGTESNDSNEGNSIDNQSTSNHSCKLKLVHKNKEEYKIITTTEKGSTDASKYSKICHLCGISISTVHGLKRHIQGHVETFNNTYHYCDLCNFKSFRMHNLREHINLHKERQFQCSSCPNRFRSITKRRHHERLNHPIVVEIHSCDCGKSFKSLLNLNWHKKKVHQKNHNIGPVQCEFCGNYFSTKETLKIHKKRRHSQKQPCEVCGIIIGKGFAYNTHMKTHQKVICTLDGCNLEFKNKQTMDYHICNFHSNKPVNCPTCNAELPSEAKLRRHVYRKHSAKVFCRVEGCIYTINRRDYLAMHYRSHTGIDENARKKLLKDLSDSKRTFY